MHTCINLTWGYSMLILCMYSRDHLVSGCIVKYDHALLVLACHGSHRYDYNKSPVQSTFTGL